MRKLNWALIACSLIGAVLMIALPILEVGDPIKLFDIPGGHGAIIRPTAPELSRGAVATHEVCFTLTYQVRRRDSRNDPARDVNALEK